MTFKIEFRKATSELQLERAKATWLTLTVRVVVVVGVGVVSTVRPGEDIALEGVGEEDREENEPVGDGTGSTELSDIRLLGR